MALQLLENCALRVCGKRNNKLRDLTSLCFVDPGFPGLSQQRQRNVTPSQSEESRWLS